MWINEIKLKNFRNYDYQEIQLHENINVFFRGKCTGKDQYC